MPTNCRLLPILGLGAMLAACGDLSRLATAPEEHRPLFQTSIESDAVDSEYEAYAVSDYYTGDQPLAPFGVTYEGFLENPESVTDDQFVQEEWRVPDWEVSYIDYDASRVDTYCEYYGGGDGGGGDDGGGYYEEDGDSRSDENQLLANGPSEEGSSIEFYAGGCEQAYNSCVGRCRRIWTPRGRALCYAACMVVYADCLRRRRGGGWYYY